MAICCIILNYNDSEHVIKLVKRIEKYDNLTYILIVDNCSTDNSLNDLKKLCNKKVHLVRTEKNGGYGYGNNFGVNYACNNLQCDRVLIANPDVEFSEHCISALNAIFEEKPDCAVAVPVQLDKNKERIKWQAWKVPTSFQYIFSALYFYDKIFQPLLYPSSHFLNQKKSCQVDCVPGSLLMVDSAKFQEIGGYDPKMFLYCEETTLGLKMKKFGYTTYLIQDCTYIHQHSASIDKSIPNAIHKRKILLHSRMVLLENHFEIDKVTKMFAKIIFRIALVEEYVKRLIKMFKYT